MMIDIDAFKQVNDSHGHEVRDQVLNKVAALLRQSARVEDVVGRFGGEEFVVVCPGANLALGAATRRTAASESGEADYPGGQRLPAGHSEHRRIPAGCDHRHCE